MIDLVAKLRLQDDFSGPMQKAIRKLDTASKSTEKLERATKKSTTSFKSFGGGITGVASGLSKVVSKLNPVALGITAVGTAAAGAYTSMKLFNATVGEALKMQQSQVVIGAMFDNESLAKQYMKMLDKIAIESPLLDSQSMYSNSKSFITVSKDIKQLEKMWDLTERLVALDPQQGLEGGIYALKELFSGDAISMVDRFEMPKAIMNEIKKLPIDKQLSELDKYFNKIGATTKLIDKMGGTALGKWAQVKERLQLVLRDMGEPSIRAVSNFLDGVLDRLEGEPIRKFATWGGKAINSIVTGLSSGAIKIYDWFTALTASEEFKRKTTLTGKIDFIVADVADKLQKWYTEVGEKKLSTFASGVVELLVGVLNNTDAFFDLGSKLGDSLSEGIIQGIKNAAIESKAGKLIKLGFVGGDNYDKAMARFEAEYAAKMTPNEERRNSHYHGIDFVPKNGYNASLHKGERVLTATENKAYSEGRGGVTIAKLADQIIVREEADIDKIAYRLAKEIELAVR